MAAKARGRIRAIRAGDSFEFVATQLGHGSTQMVVSVYGRFKPTEDEMTSWERIASAQDDVTTTATLSVVG